MPWVLNRQCVDGRLILRKERVKNFEYFEAERKNGRLILNLIPLDDTVMGLYLDGNLEQEKYQFAEEEEGDDNNEDAEVENNNESENEGFQFWFHNHPFGYLFSVLFFWVSAEAMPYIVLWFSSPILHMVFFLE